MMINKVQIEGRVSTVPTVRKFDNGEILMFSIVINEKFKDKKSGQEKEVAHFFDVEAVGSAASTSVKKGDLVTVEGSLRQDRWETPTGDKRSRVKIVAFKITPLSSEKPKKETAVVPEKKQTKTVAQPV
jgi:single-strand DNA-binding protein